MEFDDNEVAEKYISKEWIYRADNNQKDTICVVKTFLNDSIHVMKCEMVSTIFRFRSNKDVMNWCRQICKIIKANKYWRIILALHKRSMKFNTCCT